MFFFDLDKPNPDEIKNWMKINNLTIISAAKNLALVKDNFQDFYQEKHLQKEYISHANDMAY